MEPDLTPGSAARLPRLTRDAVRMAPHWAAPATVRLPVPPALIRGVSVPPASALLLERMPEYGG